MTGELLGDDGPTPEYDPQYGRYHLGWDPASSRDLSTLVVNAVAAVADRDHTELTPLNDVVDPGALNTLFAHKHDGTARMGGEVSFSLSGYEVTVEAGGRILITPPDEGESATQRPV
jgi:hypothetical protein